MTVPLTMAVMMFHVNVAPTLTRGFCTIEVEASADCRRLHLTTATFFGVAPADCDGLRLATATLLGVAPANWGSLYLPTSIIFGVAADCALAGARPMTAGTAAAATAAGPGRIGSGDSRVEWLHAAARAAAPRGRALQLELRRSRRPRAERARLALAAEAVLGGAHLEAERGARLVLEVALPLRRARPPLRRGRRQQQQRHASAATYFLSFLISPLL